MAITFRAAQQAGHATAIDMVMTLPATMVDGELVIAWVVKDRVQIDLDFPAGWTQIMSNTASVCLGYKIWHTGDPTTVTVTDSGGTSAFWWVGCVLAYSGVDQSNPIRSYSINPLWYPSITAIAFQSSHSAYLAPSVVPDLEGSVHVALYARSDSGGGGSWSTPSGYTARYTDTFGPCCFVCDKALGTTPGQTTELASTGQSVFLEHYHVGASLILKEAGSPASLAHDPVISQGGTTYGQANGTTATVDILRLSPQDGDLVLVELKIDTVSGAVITAVPTGFTALVTNLNDAYIYVGEWHTSDATSLVFTKDISGWTSFVAHLYRVAGGDAGDSPGIDTFGTATGTGTVSSPALTPASVDEHLQIFFSGVLDSNQTWTMPSGPVEFCAGVWPAVLSGHVSNVDAVTSAYAATLTGSGTVNAIAVLISPSQGSIGAFAGSSSLLGVGVEDHVGAGSISGTSALVGVVVADHVGVGLISGTSTLVGVGAVGSSGKNNYAVTIIT